MTEPTYRPGAAGGYLSRWSLVPRRLRPCVRCSARRTSGEPCRAWAMHGGTVCSAHGGMARQVRAAAAARLEMAAADVYLAQLERAARAAEAKRAAEARRLLGLAPGAQLKYGDWLAVGALKSIQASRQAAADQARMRQMDRVLDDLEAELLSDLGEGA